MDITKINYEDNFGVDFESDIINSYHDKNKPKDIDFGFGPAEEYLPGNGILY